MSSAREIRAVVCWPMDPGTDDTAVVVRVTDAIQRAGDWALVLHSAGIDHRVDIREGALALIVGGVGYALVQRRDASPHRP